MPYKNVQDKNAWSKKWYQLHTEYYEEYRKQWYIKNKQKHNAYTKEYYLKNKKHMLEKGKLWASKNKNHIKEYHEEWYETVGREKNRLNYQKNKKRICIKTLERYHSDSLFRMKSNLSSRLRATLLRINVRKNKW